MEKQGFLTRVQNPEDLREKLLCLTPLGQKTAGDMRDAITRVQDQAFKNFTPEELEQMKSYLRRIGANLDAILETATVASQHEEGVY